MDNTTTIARDDVYFQRLLHERQILQARKDLPLCLKLIEDEIGRLERTRSSISAWPQNHRAASPRANPQQMILYIPVDKYPQYNFIGRILGPRGMSLKHIEHETGCKIMIRGKGSMRSKEKEEEKKNKPGWEHLSEPLHVLIEGNPDAAIGFSDIKKAHDVIAKLLVPVPEGHDPGKKAQLQQLAILNGQLDVTRVRSNQSPTSPPTTPPLPSSGSFGYNSSTWSLDNSAVQSNGFTASASATSTNGENHTSAVEAASLATGNSHISTLFGLDNSFFASMNYPFSTKQTYQ